jgi:hypothetical protein
MSPYLDPPSSPFDPSIQEWEPQTLPLDEIIRLAIKAAVMNVNVWLPAKIVKVSGNQKVDIQPLLQSRLLDGTIVTLPVIPNVPVEMPNGVGWSIKLPIAVGDMGRAVFCDRSLDAWLAGAGGIVDPQDSRHHELTDACFVPGLVPFSAQTTDSTTDMVLTNGDSAISIQKAGTFLFKNKQNELLDLLDQITGQVQSLANTLSSDTVNTIFGPMPLNAFAMYETIANQLTSLQTKLESLKGT